MVFSSFLLKCTRIALKDSNITNKRANNGPLAGPRGMSSRPGGTGESLRGPGARRLLCVEYVAGPGAAAVLGYPRDRALAVSGIA